MSKIQQEIKPQIKNIRFAHCKSINQLYLPAIERKLSGPSLRSFFVVHIYLRLEAIAKACGYPFKALKIQELNALAFSADSQMAEMYMLNHLIDQKFGVKNIPSRNDHSIGLEFLKDRLYDFIDHSFSSFKAKKIQPRIRQAFKEVAAGQFIDTRYGFEELSNNALLRDMKCFARPINFHSIRPIIDRLIEDYPEVNNSLEVYFTRAYLVSAPLFREYTQILCDLTGFKYDMERKNLLAFAEVFGVMIQLINDIADFVYEKGTSNKKKNDVLSDLKNQTITLPIILHHVIPHPNGMIETYKASGKKTNLKNKHNEVLKEMMQSKAIPLAMGVGRQIAEQATIHIERTNTFLDNGTTLKKHLLDLMKIALENRYYYHIYKAKRLYKQEGFGPDILYRCEDSFFSRKKNPIS